MYRIHCSEIWGGIKNEDVDACSAVLTSSLYSSACDGGKGGDIYFFSVCQGDLLTRIAIADVVGHGEKVSRVSQWLYDSLHERMNGGDGGEILAELNRLANERGQDALTTAAIIGFYRPDSSVYFAYAGHHPMLIRRRGTARWQAVPLEVSSAKLANLPLGIEYNVRYDEQFVPVEAGDRVFLYTDGVTETPAPDGQLFGDERLRALLDEVGGKSPYELKTAVLMKLREHAGGELTHDDVTLLAIEVR
ncbi:MAG: PP2C family protein-serine/threonine phosphatase [Phycisphaerae bacterium]